MSKKTFTPPIPLHPQRIKKDESNSRRLNPEFLNTTNKLHKFALRMQDRWKANPDLRDSSDRLNAYLHLYKKGSRDRFLIQAIRDLIEKYLLA